MVHQFILSGGEVSLKTMLLIICLLLAQAGMASTHQFCGNASFVPMDQIAINKNAYLNKRVRTHAVLRTDAKEFSLLKQDENSHYGLRTSYDAESDAYKKVMALSPTPPFNVIGDFFEKLQIVEGAKYKRDLTKIRYYRQEVMVCGRLVKTTDGDYSFAVDNMQIEKSYLLPWKH